MKHPNKEEWVPYVFGEARADEARRLAAHLEECSACATEVAGWRRSLNRLDAWTLPSPDRHRVVIAPIFRWAVAAAIVLAAGIGMGRLMAPDPAAMRAAIASSVKAEMAAQIQQQVAQSEERMLAASRSEIRELWRGFNTVLAEARQEDRQAMLAVLQPFQQQQEARYVNLRRDLETMATVADQEIRLTNLKVTQLVSNNGQ